MPRSSVFHVAFLLQAVPLDFQPFPMTRGKSMRHGLRHEMLPWLLRLKRDAKDQMFGK
jgi:hypothetical protein